MIRCRNCGNHLHQTQLCEAYGPWFPEPGKNAADYAELAKKIDSMIAMDIIIEHEAGRLKGSGHGDAI